MVRLLNKVIKHREQVKQVDMFGTKLYREWETSEKVLQYQDMSTGEWVDVPEVTEEVTED